MIEREAKPKGAQAGPGLRRMRVYGAERKPEWNRPNEKSRRRIGVRVRDYEHMIAGNGSLAGAYHRPGSAKR